MGGFMMKKTLALLMACLLLTGTALAETNIYGAISPSPTHIKFYCSSNPNP